MQILVTQTRLFKTRVLQFNSAQLVVGSLGLMVTLLLLSGAIYHFIFLKAAREGWPVVGQLVKLVGRDESAQRDRFMRENLDAMAQKVGELQAKLVTLEAVSERVSNLAGVKPEDFKAITKPSDAGPVKGGGRGGPYIPIQTPSLQQLDSAVGSLDVEVEQSRDLFALIESHLFEERLKALMVPNSRPVNGPVGSGFGFRPDPFSGHAALHSGLDFPADVGTPILAAAGGVVLSTDVHPAYGNLLEIDHGNGLITRYAHTSKILVKTGDLVKRGQLVAEVGTTGRSTGPHLHFEVLVEGVPQDPAKFLASGASASRMAGDAGRSRDRRGGR